jgi:hypothetical protein
VIQARFVAVLFALAALAPSVAGACPNCIGENRLSNTLKIVAVFMALPFALAAWVIWAIRKAQVAHGEPQPPVEKASSGTVASDGSGTSTD